MWKPDSNWAWTSALTGTEHIAPAALKVPLAVADCHVSLQVVHLLEGAEGGRGVLDADLFIEGFIQAIPI